MDYKKVIKSQNVRMLILKMLSIIPDKVMIKLQYRIAVGRKLDLKEPKRYTEKLQWYKLYYRNPLMTQCVDKYSVRDYLKQKGYERLLTELYAVYDSVEEVDFDMLPDSFIIKTTNGSGSNIICTNKENLDRESFFSELKTFWKRPQKSPGREWAYDKVRNRVIVEELLVDTDNPYGGINDYKFICFNGKVECIVVDVGRYQNHQRNFYTLEWEKLDVSSDHENFGDISCPNNLKEMISIAEHLSKDFPAVRVDLYNIQGRIYFGELTFYPWSGYVNFTPDLFDYELGGKFELKKY